MQKIVDCKNIYILSATKQKTGLGKLATEHVPELPWHQFALLWKGKNEKAGINEQGGGGKKEKQAEKVRWGGRKAIDSHNILYS